MSKYQRKLVELFETSGETIPFLNDFLVDFDAKKIENDILEIRKYIYSIQNKIVEAAVDVILSYLESPAFQNENCLAVVETYEKIKKELTIALNGFNFKKIITDQHHEVSVQEFHDLHQVINRV